MKDTEIRASVREGYGKIPKEIGSCCGPKSKSSSCCNNTASARDASKSVGYSDTDMDSVPDGANLGLGGGNPLALASLNEGETGRGLGAGGGWRCFLAAHTGG